MKIRTKLRAAERRRDRARLAAPQIFPLVGDGLAARGVTAPLRGGPDSCLKRNRYGQWGQQFIVPTRSQLVAARYRDWLDARDTAIVAAAPRRTSCGAALVVALDHPQARRPVRVWSIDVEYMKVLD